jgi:soluble lytic murein transglycosylase-like protein
MSRQPLMMLCLLTCLAWQAPAHSEQAVDPQLKQRLIKALAEHESFADRYDAEVWLTDMSKRLSDTIPNEKKRLNMLRLIHAEATRSKLPVELVLAVIQVESNFDRFAISNSGARGLMQVMPFWLKELKQPNANLFNIETNLRFGCTILRYYLDREKGNRTRALARYNGSINSFKYPNLVFSALRERWYR